MGTPVWIGDRVLVQTSTTGTGTYQLGTALIGYQSPATAGIPSGARISYLVVDSLTAPSQWETGEGLYTVGSPATLTRALIKRNHLGTTAAINWGVGTKYIAVVLPADRTPMFDTDGWLRALSRLELTTTFVLGIDGTERLRVDTGGNLGLGTATPITGPEGTRYLTVNGEDTIGVYLQNFGANKSYLLYDVITGTRLGSASTEPLQLDVNTAGVMWLTSNQRVGVLTNAPGYTLHVNGSVAGVGAYNNLSDERVKRDVAPSGYGLAAVRALAPIRFRYVAHGDEWHIGFSAQQVQTVIPEAAAPPAGAEDGLLSLRDTPILAACVAAIQELAARVEALEAALAAQEGEPDA